MKILVTGANGYIGKGVVECLVKHNVNVIATDYQLDRELNNVEYVDADIFSIEKPYTFFHKPDAILHLAWRNGFVHNSMSHIEDFPRHVLFLKKMMEEGIARICVMGSMHEVGFYEGSIDESTPCHPQSLYGISKNALYNATKLIADDNACIFQWIRGFYIVGNTTAGCSIFSKITQAENRGETEFPFTMGLNQYDFINYEEFCEQVSAVVTQNDINGIVNCCSGSPMRLGERVEAFIRENNYKIALKYGAFPDRPYDSKAIWGNNEKILQIMDKQKSKGVGQKI